VTCRLRIALPSTSWLHVFTTRNPEFRIEVFDRFPVTARQTLAEVRFHGPRESGWESELERLPDVEQVEVLEEQHLSTLCQVAHATPPWLELARKLRIMWRQPIWVERGVARWTVVASEERVRELLTAISPTVDAVRVESVVRGANRRATARLTPRQDELVRRAVSEGYFDVPRKISLTVLAERLSVSKSTLSERLAIVERKLIAEEASSGAFSEMTAPEGFPAFERDPSELADSADLP
jgi:predicted DNA binding protein